MHSSDHDQSASRRNFLKKSAIGAAVATTAATGILTAAEKKQEEKAFKLPPLPYAANALEPYISAKTMKIHHDSHYRKFMQEVAARTKDTVYKNASLERIILETYGGITMIETLHIMAVLSWNHDFFWKSMKPGGGGEMPKKLNDEIKRSFGSIDTFKKKFKEAAMTLGSGWAWLVREKDKLAVSYTSYHKTPLLQKQIPLLTLDCWEHSYYLDYQNRKDKYIDAYLNHCVNWEFAQQNMAKPE